METEATYRVSFTKAELDLLSAAILRHLGQLGAGGAEKVSAIHTKLLNAESNRAVRAGKL